MLQVEEDRYCDLKLTRVSHEVSIQFMYFDFRTFNFNKMSSDRNCGATHCFSA
jgi:hypothetical protein